NQVSKPTSALQLQRNFECKSGRTLQCSDKTDPRFSLIDSILEISKMSTAEEDTTNYNNCSDNESSHSKDVKQETNEVALQKQKTATSATVEAEEEDHQHEDVEIEHEVHEHEVEFADEAEKSTASPCSVPEPEHCSFRTPPPPVQQSSAPGDSMPMSQSELLGKFTRKNLTPISSTPQPQDEPQSAASCSSSHSVASVEVERSCMETRGLVNVKWDITRKNKASIVIDGYKMTESRAGKDGRVFWRCSKRFCPATAISLAQRLVSVRQVDARRFHNHPPTGKEEFFRGDFANPGTPTQVTIKWPVTRLSVTGSLDVDDNPAAAASVVEDSHPASEDLEGGGSNSKKNLSIKRSALLRRRRERRRGEQQQQQLCRNADGASAVEEAGGLQVADDCLLDADSTALSGGGPGLQYRDSSLLLGSSAESVDAPQAKRVRHESLEDLASIQQRLTDSLSGVAGLETAQGGGGLQSSSAAAANLFSLAAVGSHSSSPLKEALSQIDNSQLRRQLRRLENYFRSGIVAVSEAILRQSVANSSAQLTGSAFGFKAGGGASSEQERLGRLLNYLEGLE
uniref:FLYWCH-type domain-containing protein n=1 Tax=Macrostomum lignano TaxID=282301 RepID=A0A1I8IT67_9PLAT